MENPKKLVFPGRTDHFIGKVKHSTDKEEVEDMANCLMLLSRGKNPDPSVINGRDYQTVDRDYQTVDRGSKFYRCKTCDKVFESFQALGGHRSSHKKPGKASLILSDRQNPNPRLKGGHGPGLGIKLATNKVHECSICGSVFGSGQALGGHMRRHRPANADVASSGESYKKARSNNYVLELDLNLPAPEDSDSGDSLSYGFGFALSGATPLVDCGFRISD